MRRLERLINLVATLLEADHPLTARDVRLRVPGYPEDKAAFRRTFERDKEMLREMGVPITREPVGDAGLEGYRIPKEEYYLRDPGLDAQELAALHLAASAVKLEGARGMEALWKLGGEPTDGRRTAAMAALPASHALEPMFTAISERRPVAFDYRGRRREVDPHRLAFRAGHWYLAARDRHTGQDRSFRLDRLESAVAPAGPPGAFERASMGPDRMAPWETGDEDPVSARVLVDADQAGWAAGHVGPEAVEEWRDDGSVVLAVKVTNRAGFRSFVLGFLDHAEVLSPLELRQDVVSWLEALCRA
jgi:proteasome accessory factor B